MALRKPTAGGNVAPSLHPNEPRVAAPAGPEPRTLTLPASMSGAGGLSAEDLAAIRGEVATVARLDDPAMTDDDREALGVPVDRQPTMRAFDDQGTPNALGELAQRLATLEHKFGLLERAMEAGFAQLAAGQAPVKVAPTRPANIDYVPMPATQTEQDTYCSVNFAIHTIQRQGLKPYDHIDAWRHAGRPDVERLMMSPGERVRYDHAIDAAKGPTMPHIKMQVGDRRMV